MAVETLSVCFEVSIWAFSFFRSRPPTLFLRVSFWIDRMCTRNTFGEEVCERCMSQSANNQYPWSFLGKKSQFIIKDGCWGRVNAWRCRSYVHTVNCACLFTYDSQKCIHRYTPLSPRAPRACPIWMQIASRMATNWRELLHKWVSCRKHTVRWGTPQAQILEPKGTKQHRRISSEATTLTFLPHHLSQHHRPVSYCLKFHWVGRTKSLCPWNQCCM